MLSVDQCYAPVAVTGSVDRANTSGRFADKERTYHGSTQRCYMQPKPAHLGEAYAAQFSDPSIVAAYHYRPPYPAATFPMLAGLIGSAPRVVLDAGCGTGDIARGLLLFVERIDAVDRSAPMIEAGRLLPSGDDRRLRWIVGEV